MGTWMGALEDEGINNGIEHGGKPKPHLPLQACEIGTRTSLPPTEGRSVSIHTVTVPEYLRFRVHPAVSAMYRGATAQTANKGASASRLSAARRFSIAGTALPRPSPPRTLIPEARGIGLPHSCISVSVFGIRLVEAVEAQKSLARCVCLVLFVLSSG